MNIFITTNYSTLQETSFKLVSLKNRIEFILCGGYFSDIYRYGL